MILILCILSFASGTAAEDSNSFYLMDWHLSNYSTSWVARFDSATNSMRSSQGCLDYGHWYMNINTKCEAELFSTVGIRYRNYLHDDHRKHLLKNYFDLFFQLKKDLRLFFTAAPTYYKGENELGIGIFIGKNYLNCLEASYIIEDLDRNASLKYEPDGPDKIIYNKYPIKLTSYFNKYWKTGHLTLKFEVTNTYKLQSTEPIEIHQPNYQEKGFHRYFHIGFWQDIDKLRFGAIFDLQQLKHYESDLDTEAFKKNMVSIITEPMIAYKLTEKWRPHFYLTYNYKAEDDSIHVFSSHENTRIHYRRNIYAYLFDIEFHPGGNFIWHFGMQRQFYYNNQGIDFKERRFTLGFECYNKNVSFYIVEAMEGDFPTPKWLHNRTYVQLMLRF